MKRFKVGDKVRYKMVDGTLTYNGEYIVNGTRGCESSSEPAGTYGVMLKGEGDHDFWWDHRFELVISEPELNYPIHYVHRDGNESGLICKPNDDSEYVTVCTAVYGELDNDGGNSDWTAEDVRQFIKDGVWIVLSSGSQKAPEAPTSPSNEISVGTLTINSKAATEAVKELTQALKECENAYERLQRVMKGD